MSVGARLSNRRKLRFGLEHDGRYSQYWVFGLVAGRDDIYVSSERTGDSLHVSLHESTQHWHLKVTREGVTTEKTLETPAQQYPGITRVLQIVLPVAVARYEAVKRLDGVRWLDVDDGCEAVVNVFIEEAGTNPNWPSIEIPGSSVLGRAELHSDRTVTVVAWSRPASKFPIIMPIGDEERERIRRQFSEHGGFAVVIATAPDRSHVILEQTVEVAAATT